MKAAVAMVVGALAAAAGPPPIPVAEARTVAGAGSASKVLETSWNGRPVAFIDWQVGADTEGVREVAVVWRAASGRFACAAVTTGEQEGGVPELAALGFANADQDAASELIVILKWPVNHYDVGGSLYEVRLFDDLRGSPARLRPLTRLSRRFGSGCDCDWRDGTRKRYRFKTIAAVRAELARRRVK